jgi:hypothetical protein
MKTPQHDNNNPPWLDTKWKYDSHTDLLKTFKEKYNWKPPTERKSK